MNSFPSLAGLEPTRQTLHAYSKAVTIIPRTHLPTHPKWWHIGLDVQANGLITKKIPLTNTDSLQILLNLEQHAIQLLTKQGEAQTISMQDGLTGTEMGEAIVTAVAAFGLTGDYDRSRFENESPTRYEAPQAENFRQALQLAHQAFNEHRQSISGETGPINFWSHHFDLSTEWFGTRLIKSEEHGEVQEFPSQINLGFYAGDDNTDPYFYSNPWPFEKEKLVDKPLPAGARWFIESWEGSILPYSELIGDNTAVKRLREYAKTVYDLASPTLLA